MLIYCQTNKSVKNFKLWGCRDRRGGFRGRRGDKLQIIIFITFDVFLRLKLNMQFNPNYGCLKSVNFWIQFSFRVSQLLDFELWIFCQVIPLQLNRISLFVKLSGRFSSSYKFKNIDLEILNWCGWRLTITTFNITVLWISFHSLVKKWNRWLRKKHIWWNSSSLCDNSDTAIQNQHFR